MGDYYFVHIAQKSNILILRGSLYNGIIESHISRDKYAF